VSLLGPQTVACRICLSDCSGVHPPVRGHRQSATAYTEKLLDSAACMSATKLSTQDCTSGSNCNVSDNTANLCHSSLCLTFSSSNARTAKRVAAQLKQKLKNRNAATAEVHQDSARAHFTAAGLCSTLHMVSCDVYAPAADCSYESNEGDCPLKRIPTSAHMSTK
jgi:hypothetical protein